METDFFYQRGWLKFNFDPGIALWAEAALCLGMRVIADPQKRTEHLDCEGTWFVGVNALPSNHKGQIGAIPLQGPVINWLSHIQTRDLHPAQLSVIFEGYPKPRKGETEKAFMYRLNRDAAHLDGLLPIGIARRRMLKEPHAYILGLPLNKTPSNASPLVIWEGSHVVMADYFQRAFKGIPTHKWDKLDLTDTYNAARRKVFKICPRVKLHAYPGEAYVVHRLSLHGVARWASTATAPKEGRMIAYFRPELEDPSLWPDLN